MYPISKKLSVNVSKKHSRWTDIWGNADVAKASIQRHPSHLLSPHSRIMSVSSQWKHHSLSDFLNTSMVCRLCPCDNGYNCTDISHCSLSLKQQGKTAPAIFTHTIKYKAYRGAVMFVWCLQFLFPRGIFGHGLSLLGRPSSAFFGVQSRLLFIGIKHLQTKRQLGP